MAYFVKKEDESENINKSRNVKVCMKIEDTEETYNLFLEEIKTIYKSKSMDRKKENQEKKK